MVRKIKKFSHLLGRSFGFGSPIGLEALSSVISLIAERGLPNAPEMGSKILLSRM